MRRPSHNLIWFVIVSLIFCAALTILVSVLPSELFWIWIQPSQVTKQTSCRIMAYGITSLHNIIKWDGKLEFEWSLFMKIQHQVSDISIVSKLPVCRLAFWYICFLRIQNAMEKEQFMWMLKNRFLGVRSLGLPCTLWSQCCRTGELKAWDALLM